VEQLIREHNFLRVRKKSREFFSRCRSLYWCKEWNIKVFILGLPLASSSGRLNYISQLASLYTLEIGHAKLWELRNLDGLDFKNIRQSSAKDQTPQMSGPPNQTPKFQYPPTSAKDQFTKQRKMES